MRQDWSYESSHTYVFGNKSLKFSFLFKLRGKTMTCTESEDKLLTSTNVLISVADRERNTLTEDVLSECIQNDTTRAWRLNFHVSWALSCTTEDTSYHFFLKPSCDEIRLKGVIFCFIFLWWNKCSVKTSSQRETGYMLKQCRKTYPHPSAVQGTL